MTQEEINKMFEGRWRIKSQNLEKALDTMLIEHRIDHVKKLCRDFFEAGILLAGDSVVNPPEVVQVIDTERLPLYTIGEAIDFHKSFSTWWNLYDKKRGREKCLKKWEKLSVKEREACIAATPAYVASTPDKQYRKDPQTFLNNKSWEDEIISRNSKDQQMQQRIVESANLVAKYTGANK